MTAREIIFMSMQGGTFVTAIFGVWKLRGWMVRIEDRLKYIEKNTNGLDDLCR